MNFVDGYLIPISTRNVAAYRQIAKKASKLWMEHGALEYHECVGDDLKVNFGVSFPKRLKTKPGETVIFAYIVYKSRAHRDKVNKKVMADPRLATLCDAKNMPFDCKQMSYGGFQMIVSS